MICPVVVVPTGHDRSFLAVEADERLPLDQFTQALAKVDFKVVFATSWREDSAPPRLAVPGGDRGLSRRTRTRGWAASTRRCRCR